MLAILAAPLALQVSVLIVMDIAHHPRYFAIALPAVFLVGGYGVAAAARFLGRLSARTSGSRWIEVLALSIVILVSAVPLQRHYRTPKQDYLGAMAAVDSLAGDNDVKVGVHLAEHVINGHYAAGYEAAESLKDLEAIERAATGRVWVVTTLERIVLVHDRRLYDHIKDRYRRVAVLPGTVGDGAMRIYVKEG